MNSLKYNHPSTNHRKSEDINYYINEQEEPISTYDQLLSPPLTIVPTNWLTNSSSSPTCSSIPSPMMNPYHHQDLSIWSNLPNNNNEDDYYTSTIIPTSHPHPHHHHQQQQQEFDDNHILSINTYHIPDDNDYHHHHQTSLSPPYTIDSSSLSPDLNTNTNINNINNSSITIPPLSSSPSSTELPSPETILLSDKYQLQQWTKNDLIERVLLLEKELLLSQQQVHSLSSSLLSDGSSIKQDGWQCKWVSCDKVTSTLEQLTEHLYRVHVGRGKANYFCGWVGCARHDKPFTKRHKMHNHLRTHTGERPFVCNAAGCHKRFSRPDSLSTHLKTHSNVRPYVCNDCGKSYFHARSLRKHLKASNHVSQV